MRKFALAAFLFGLIFAAGCKHPGSRKLTGHWRGVKAEGVADTAQRSADEFAKRTEIIVKGNRIDIRTPTSHPAEATYTVDKEEASVVVIHTDREPKETFTFDEKGASMVWKIDAQRSLTFTKVE